MKSLRAKERPTMDRFVATGYVGLWLDGVPGWCSSQYLRPRQPDGPPLLSRNPNTKGAKFYRAIFSVQLLKDRRGRFIVRRAK